MKKLFTILFLLALVDQALAQCVDLTVDMYPAPIYVAGFNARQMCWPAAACSPSPVVLSIGQSPGVAIPGLNTVIVGTPQAGVVATVTSPSCDTIYAQGCIGQGPAAEVSFMVPSHGQFVVHVEASQGTANISVQCIAGGQAPQPSPQCTAVGMVPQIAEKVRYRSFDPLTGRLGDWQDMPAKGFNVSSSMVKVWGL